MEWRLFDMFKRVIDNIDNDRMLGESVESFMLTWDQAMRSVRHRQLQCGAPSGIEGR
jgi:hypothetical protein